MQGRHQVRSDWAHRAYFSLLGVPAALKVKQLSYRDSGTYVCSVTHQHGVTTSVVHLAVLGPLEPPVIRNEAGEPLKDVAGPYNEGDTATLHCEVKASSSHLPDMKWVLSGMEGAEEGAPLSGSAVSTMSTSLSTAAGEGEAPQVLVRSRVHLGPLTRSHLGAILSCRVHNHVSAPAHTSVVLDLNLSPLSARILRTAGGSLTAGLPVEMVCESWGSRPPAAIEWWLGTSRLPQTFGHASADGNVSTSVVTFTPSHRDHGGSLGCIARNPVLPQDSPAPEDRWTMNVYYKPKVHLQIGSPFRGGNVQEGTDVYFECMADSNPPASEIQWFKDGSIDLASVPPGPNGTDVVVVSGRFLALQKLTRSLSGHYACSATNSEGTATSKSVAFKVQHPPACAHGGPVVYSASRHEPVRVTCEVIAEPRNVSFRWVFSSNNRNRDLVDFEVIDPHKSIHQTGHDHGHRSQSAMLTVASVLEYTPQFQSDFGTLLCSAQNVVGVQKEPCTFHVVQAGPPESLENCSVSNLTEKGFSVECRSESGLRVATGSMTAVPRPAKGHGAVVYVLELYGPPDVADVQHGISTPQQQVLLRNLSGEEPWFRIWTLSPGTEYEVRVYATNNKGRSRPVVLSACTLPPAEALLDKVPPWTLGFSILHWTLICVLILVITLAVLLLIYLRKRLRSGVSKSNNTSKTKSPQVEEEPWSLQMTQMSSVSRSNSNIITTKDEVTSLDKRKNTVDI
ncbi:hemicentin-2-like [Ornithodoros turicata]|uniref:hemicentin-2-like n=1 Tax=Ornithodoros turicata TaxID=34597 RepID=UPI003139052D